MQFGRVKNPQELDAIDFALPADKFTFAQTPNDSFELFVGAPAWNEQRWVGKFYPKGTKMLDFLPYYSHQFNSIELSSTHYAFPDQQKLSRWVASVPAGFQFCPKVSQLISHKGGLNDQTRIMDFCSDIRKFADHLGITFIQLHEAFSPDEFSKLKTFLEIWPANIPLAVEVRHPDWFIDDHEIFNLLAQQNRVLVVTDVAGRRDLLHMNVSPVQVVRFAGNDLHPTDYVRIDNWVERISQWKSYGVHTVYFFLHEPDEIYCPEISAYFVRKCREAGLTQMPEISLVAESKQLSMFS